MFESKEWTFPLKVTVKFSEVLTDGSYEERDLTYIIYKPDTTKAQGGCSFTLNLVGQSPAEPTKIQPESGSQGENKLGMDCW